MAWQAVLPERSAHVGLKTANLSHVTISSMKVTTGRLRRIMRLTPLQNVSVCYNRQSVLAVFSARACFFTNSIIRRDPRAPSIVGKQRSQQIHHFQNVASSQRSGYAKWPVAVLAAAENSGALTFTPERAITILEDFQALGSKPVRNFCTGMDDQSSFPLCSI